MRPINVVVKQEIEIVTTYDDTSINHYIVRLRYDKRTITTRARLAQ
jgi:hypothetical protein